VRYRLVRTCTGLYRGAGHGRAAEGAMRRELPPDNQKKFLISYLFQQARSSLWHTELRIRGVFIARRIYSNNPNYVKLTRLSIFIVEPFKAYFSELC
jgi:hypothetical protein